MPDLESTNITRWLIVIGGFGVILLIGGFLRAVFASIAAAFRASKNKAASKKTEDKPVVTGIPLPAPMELESPNGDFKPEECCRPIRCKHQCFGCECGKCGGTRCVGTMIPSEGEVQRVARQFAIKDRGESLNDPINLVMARCSVNHLHYSAIYVGIGHRHNWMSERLKQKLARLDASTQVWKD